MATRSGLAGFLLALELLTGCSREEPRSGKGPPAVLHVGAAASLRDLLGRWQPRDPDGRPSPRIETSFAASSTLVRQVRDGAPIEILLSADAECLDRIADRLVPGSRREILTNLLALVGRPGSAPMTSLAELRDRGGAIAVAAPAVPAGRYARERLRREGLVDALAGRLVEADDVRAALALVESETADFAIVYLSDARIAKRARLLWTAGRDEAPRPAYQGALVKGAGPAAAAYLAALSDESFLAEAEALGFGRPNS